MFAGFINGALIAYTRIPPFIATLGMMVSARGVAKWWSKGNPISFPTDSYATIGKGMMPVLHLLGAGDPVPPDHDIIPSTASTPTPSDRMRLPRGCPASRSSATRCWSISIAGVLAGDCRGGAELQEPDRAGRHGGDVRTGRHRDGRYRRRIACSGGRGSIVGTVIGALIFGVIISGFTFLRLDAYYQEMVKGAIIVGAVVLDQWRQRRDDEIAIKVVPAKGNDLRSKEGSKMEDMILKTEGLTKHYGGRACAAKTLTFEIRKGEHVAIMGDNGAGKSTFVRQITAVEQRTRGTIIFDGKEVNFDGPMDAREAGIETVFQTLALADDLDVPDNLFLGREKILLQSRAVFDPRLQGHA